MESVEMVSSSIRPGLLIISTSLLALLICNLGYGEQYNYIWNQKIHIGIGPWFFEKQLLYLINEGLMALFFLLITIEIRYEFLYGFLNDKRYMMLPLVGALGGILIPAMVYQLFNWGVAESVGWAIPVATDIAFSLACLLILGPRFSPKVRILLLSLAIFDDLGAILIIAFYYSSNLSLLMLSIAMVITMIMLLLNGSGYQNYVFYYLLGMALWGSLLKSGVHATLSGSILAMMLPMQKDDGDRARQLYDNLLPWVKFFILPVFTFANTGVLLSQGIASNTLFLGVVLGLLIGKPLGIISFSYLSNFIGLSSMPKGINYHHIIGISLLCGIGYTMSLFIGSLAFDGELSYLLDTVKISVMFASLIAGLLGMLYLRLFCEDKYNA